MKKFLAILMAVCMMATLLCVPAFAAETEDKPVMHVLYGSMSKDFDDFEDGWNFAMEQANSGKEVHVTLLADWTADKEGRFTDDTWNGDGFDHDTIYFADDVTVTLDLGGYTIDRALKDSEADGEVIFINDDANVTIKNGTIKGGYSNNGAGGIHIEGANVKLIDLVITGNHVVNDDGTAIQHVGGGELYMKNCRIVDNDGSNKGYDIYGAVYLDGVDKVLIEDCYFADNDNVDYGAGIYADTCNDFVIKNCTFENLHAGDRGGAIWVSGELIDNVGFSRLYIYNCKFNNNSCGNYGGAIYTKSAELHVYDSEFKGNYSEWNGGAIYLNANMVHSGSVSSYFYRCTFDGNRADEDGGAIFCACTYTMMTRANTYGCDFINNSAGENGGAVCLDGDCPLHFSSDEETGKAGTIKNNSAGNLGGGVYQGKNAPIFFVGEIYASENVSSMENDDIYITSGFSMRIGKITSPEGSIGIRYKNDDGCRLENINDENKDLNLKVFFFNNEGLEMIRSEYRYSNLDDTMIPCLAIAKKSSAVGSIFGEGSLAMIVAITALIASAAAIFVSVSSKKKAVSSTANNVEETEDEE